MYGAEGGAKRERGIEHPARQCPQTKDLGNELANWAQPQRQTVAIGQAQLANCPINKLTKSKWSFDLHDSRKVVSIYHL